MTINIFESFPLPFKPYRSDSDGPDECLHTHWVLLQESNPILGKPGVFKIGSKHFSPLLFGGRHSIFEGCWLYNYLEKRVQNIELLYLKELIRL